jgi:hypothetical protein
MVSGAVDIRVQCVIYYFPSLAGCTNIEETKTVMYIDDLQKTKFHKYPNQGLIYSKSDILTTEMSS